MMKSYKTHIGSSGWPLIVCPLGSLLLLALTGPSCKKRSRTSATSAAEETQLRLPISSSKATPLRAPEIRLGTRSLALDGRALVRVREGKIDAESKRDGPDGYFVDPLFKELRAEITRRKGNREALGKLLFGGVRIAVDASHSYRALKDALFAPALLGFQAIQLLARRTDGTSTMMLVKAAAPDDLQPQKKRRDEGLLLTVRQEEHGFIIQSRYGRECPVDTPHERRVCIPTPPYATTTRALHSLQQHLWYLFSQKYRGFPESGAESRHQIKYVPSNDIRMRTLVRVLDTLRERPHQPKRPSGTQTLPVSRCIPVFDQSLNSWVFPTNDKLPPEKGACMYHRITLSFED